MNESAEFASVWDKLEGRELLQSGKRGNVLQVFEDRPAEYEAWNIDDYYEQHMWEINDLQSMEWVESGPVRSVLQVKDSSWTRSLSRRSSSMRTRAGLISVRLWTGSRSICC
ncbi:glycoside hydrolase family 38 C-terminal domain-containing protein [Paenibacillus amylolyticus]|nr:glycoside hydrolase family 38 C-terminal domain-containing protein [Paenibacillus amylolyticus]